MDGTEDRRPKERRWLVGSETPPIFWLAKNRGKNPGAKSSSLLFVKKSFSSVKRVKIRALKTEGGEKIRRLKIKEEKSGA